MDGLAFHVRGPTFAPDDRVPPRRHSHGDGRRPRQSPAGRRRRARISKSRSTKDSTPRRELNGTLGTKGGIFARPVPGKFGDLRFNRPAALGVDGQGNVYVASSGATAGGSTVLECYSPAGQCRWRRLGLEFVDLADLDPGSERDVFTKEEHFAMDWSKPAGQEWSYQGYTVNPLKYPHDPRLHLSTTHVWLRRLSGKPFLFVSDMTGEFLHVYRFTPQTDGETAIPCACSRSGTSPARTATRRISRRKGSGCGRPQRQRPHGCRRVPVQRPRRPRHTRSR